MARSPRLNALRVFDAAARHLNFRSAANELNVTQGAVAQTIRGMEADLGIGLFRRLPRGVSLTNSGLRYHDGVAKGLAAIDQATDELLSGSSSITISVPPSFASKWLVPRLPYFLELNPHVEIRTIATEAIVDLHSQNVDLAVRQGGRPSDRDLVSMALSPVELVVVCSQDVASRVDPAAGIAQFAALPLIQDGHRHWNSLLDDGGGGAPRHLLSFNQTALAIDAAIAGQGFAVVPRFIAAADLAAKRLVVARTVEKREPGGFWIVHSKGDPPNREARSRFVDWLVSEAQR